MSNRYLIKGGSVLTLGSRTQNHANADVLIEGDRIAEVGPGIRARTAEVIDARDTVVMPGFVDGHRHSWKSMFRNLGVKVGPDEVDRLQADDVYAATLISLLGAIEAGITTVVDWCDHPFPEAAVEAHNDAGLRSVLGTDTGRFPIDNEAVAHASDDSSTWSKARAAGFRVHTHSRAGGVIASWGEERLLGPDLTIVHCSGATEADLSALSGTGTRVVISPTNEMSEGQTPRLQSFIDRKIRPGLGVDDDSMGPGDIFAQMRALISLQHATFFDLKLAGKAGLPHLMTTREAIRHGTIEGARAVGLEATTGSLEPGKQADLIVLRADRPNIAPVNDPIGAVVWGMDTSNLDWVFAHGNPLMKSGVLTADLDRAKSLVLSAQQRVADINVSAALAGEGA